MLSHENKYRLLHLASWYPNRTNPLEGIFVQKHVRVASEASKTAVLYITFDLQISDSTFNIESHDESGIFVVRVYVRTLKQRIPVLSTIINVLRYCVAYFYGWKRIKEEFGIPNIVVVNVAGRFGIVAIFLKIVYGIPYVVIEHSTRFVKFNSRFKYFVHVSFIENLLSYCSFRFADTIIAVSRYLSDAIRHIYKIKKDVKVVPNVITVPERLPKRLLDKEKIKILTISNLVNEHKGIDRLLAVFQGIASVDSRLELHIIGDGPDREKLYAQAQEYGMLDKKIFFYGAQPNDRISWYFSWANFFVLNSRYETFSVATAESLAHGVPVLISKSGGPEEFVTKEFGITFDGESNEALKEGLYEMIENWKTFNSEKMYRFANEKFNGSIVGVMLSNIYNSIIFNRTAS